MQRWTPVSQTQELKFSTCPESSRPIADVLDPLYIAAHLLTGSSTQAEKAILQAMDWWNPCDEPQETLCRMALETAARITTMPPHADSNEERMSECYLPADLRRVLRLPAVLRRCFVLRILIGFPSQVCAKLLSLTIRHIDRYSSIAAERLSAVNRSQTTPAQASVFNY